MPSTKRTGSRMVSVFPTAAQEVDQRRPQADVTLLVRNALYAIDFAEKVGFHKLRMSAYTVFFGAGNTLGKGKTDARGKVTIGGLSSGDVLIGAKHEEMALVEPQELVLPERGKASALLNMRRGGFLTLLDLGFGIWPFPMAAV